MVCQKPGCQLSLVADKLHTGAEAAHKRGFETGGPLNSETTKSFSLLFCAGFLPAPYTWFPPGLGSSHANILNSRIIPKPSPCRRKLQLKICEFVMFLAIFCSDPSLIQWSDIFRVVWGQFAVSMFFKPIISCSDSRHPVRCVSRIFDMSHSCCG